MECGVWRDEPKTGNLQIRSDASARAGRRGRKHACWERAVILMWFPNYVVTITLQLYVNLVD